MLSFYPEVDMEQRASEIANLRDHAFSLDTLPSFKNVTKENKMIEYEKAIKGYLEGFKFDPSFYHIHPLTKLCYTPSVAATVCEWPPSMLSLVLHSSKTRFTPNEAKHVLQSVGIYEDIHPIRKATLDMHVEHYRFIKYSEEVPVEVENFLKGLVIDMVAQMQKF